MAKVTTEKLLELAKQSGLVTQDQLDAFVAKIEQEDGQLPGDQEALAARMVDAKLVTRWQVDKLLEGKHKGFLLGNYKLLGSLGKGGMSSVYLAEHILMQRRVAIKVLPQDRVRDSSYLDRFRQEARAAARLDDPNVVRAFEADNVGDTYYLVMEYVDGKDLHVMVNQTGPLPFEMAADFIAQAARGLQHAHEVGLVHRDIKPANLLVDKKKTVKVLDLGLAKFQETEDASLTLAHEDHVLGTADYLAPEQAINSHAVDFRSDIYGLGCTLYFLLTGHPPFNEGSIRERLLKHQVESPPSIFKDRPDAPPGLVNICNRMMNKKPELRPGSASEVEEFLNSWLADRGYDRTGSGSSTNLKRQGNAIGLPRFSRSYGQPQSETESAGAGDTKKKLDHDEEEIGFAPLPEEDSRKKKPPRPPSESESGTSSVELATGKSSPDVKTGGSSTRTRAASSDLHRSSASSSQLEPDATGGSLIDDELEELIPLDEPPLGGKLDHPHAPPRLNSGPFPSGQYSAAGDSVPQWIWWALVGVGFVFMILLLMVVLSRG